MKAAAEDEVQGSPGDIRPRARRLLRVLAFTVVPAIFVVGLGWGLMNATRPRGVPGSPAPAFSAPLLGGGVLSSEDLKGSPAVLNFWASWCAPCREEAPSLEALWRRHRADGLRVVGVNYQDAADDATGFVEELGLTFPSVRDLDGRLSLALGVRGVPETFFIDHTWRFWAVASGDQIGARGATRVLGPVNEAVLESRVTEMLARMKEG